jgi:hypothetical protein
VGAKMTAPAAKPPKTSAQQATFFGLFTFHHDHGDGTKKPGHRAQRTPRQPAGYGLQAQGV